ncbi:MAG: TolC family protein [Reichenbachiella sp.]|uniref:TolC family protein n=1 Tax=Reichenbachiella sp. TaxID=2184521 RepID=UPI003297B4D5
MILQLKNFAACALLLVVTSASSRSQPSTWTIDQVQDSAAQNYPLIQQFDLINKASEYTISNASKAYLPQFDVTLIGGVISGAPSASQGTSTEANFISVLQVNQPIWDGGMTKNYKEIAKAKAALQNIELEVSIYEIRERVNHLFFGILLLEEQLKQLGFLEKNLQTNYKLIETHVANGTAYQSDLDEIKVEIINAAQKRTELIYASESYKKMLSAMIGTDLGANTKLIKPEKAVAFDHQINRLELSVFDHQRKLIDSQDGLNKALLYPKIGLLGFGTFIQPGINFGPSSLNNILVAGLSASWSLSPLYKNKNNNNISEINRQMIQVQEETFLYHTQLQVSQTQQEIKKYQELLERDKEIINLKKSIRASYETKYKNGVATTSQLLTRINDENTANLQMIIHDIQYLMAVYQLKTDTGN